MFFLCVNPYGSLLLSFKTQFSLVSSHHIRCHVFKQNFIFCWFFFVVSLNCTWILMWKLTLVWIRLIFFCFVSVVDPDGLFFIFRVKFFCLILTLNFFFPNFIQFNFGCWSIAFSSHFHVDMTIFFYPLLFQSSWVWSNHCTHKSIANWKQNDYNIQHYRWAIHLIQVISMTAIRLTQKLFTRIWCQMWVAWMD